ncbi:MAG TPA: hypothetical protein VGE76_24475 [Opitutaceae bacterium]
MLFPVVITSYILASFVVGFAGRNREFGFWGYFFFSLIVTPVIGLLTIVGGAPRAKN